MIQLSPTFLHRAGKVVGYYLSLSLEQRSPQGRVHPARIAKTVNSHPDHPIGVSFAARLAIDRT